VTPAAQSDMRKSLIYGFSHSAHFRRHFTFKGHLHIL
jgi:hypothetical protein